MWTPHRRQIVRARLGGRDLHISREKIFVVKLGDRHGGQLSCAEPGPPQRATFGFGRVAEKGLYLVVDAFQPARRAKCSEVTLDAAACLPPERKRVYLSDQRKEIFTAGCPTISTTMARPTRAGKMKYPQGVDVLVLPSTFDEPKGIPALEAMANGVPVIASAVAHFEMIEATGGGVLFTPDSVDSRRSHAELLSELGRDDGDVARARARTLIDRPQMAAHTEEAFREVRPCAVDLASYIRRAVPPCSSSLTAPSGQKLNTLALDQACWSTTALPVQAGVTSGCGSCSTRAAARARYVKQKVPDRRDEPHPRCARQRRARAKLVGAHYDQRWRWRDRQPDGRYSHAES